MKSITNFLLQNPTSLLLVLPLSLIATVLFYITRWPRPRPVQVIFQFHLTLPNKLLFILHCLTYPLYLLRGTQTRKADRFRPEKIPNHLDTIVIGSGSGGSTVANLLAQSGQRVLVLEQHSVTGGCTHSFREEGCEYDTGLVRSVVTYSFAQFIHNTCILINATLYIFY